LGTPGAALPFYDYFNPASINAKGDVAGVATVTDGPPDYPRVNWVVALWQAGRWQLGPIAGASGLYGGHRALNNRGEIVSASFPTSSNDQTPFIYDTQRGTVTFLDLYSAFGLRAGGVPTGINDDGQVVGFAGGGYMPIGGTAY